MREDVEVWAARFSPPRPPLDARVHAKALFPPPRLLAEVGMPICGGDLGLPVRVVRGGRVPPPRR